MRYLISIFIIIVFIAIFVQNCDRKDPYSIGMHWDYSIVCENGYIYKILGNKRGIIQILNSDGSPLKCNQKIY
jgi:hypothetical protein